MTPKPPKDEKANDRDRRSAEALRVNLHRRKSQARERAKEEPPPPVHGEEKAE